MIDKSIYQYEAVAICEFETRYALSKEMLGYVGEVPLSDSCQMEVLYPICREVKTSDDWDECILGSPLHPFEAGAEIDDWGNGYSYKPHEEPVEYKSKVVALRLFSTEPFGTKGEEEKRANEVMNLYATLIELRIPDAIRTPSDDYAPRWEERIKVFGVKDETGKAKCAITLPVCFDIRNGLIGREDAEFAIKRANKRLTIYYLYLNNAQKCKDQGDWRSCVLNCATACELVVRDRVEKYCELNKVPEDLEKYVIGKVNGFGGYCELCKKLRVEVKCAKDVKDDVMGIRNRIIHGGYVPTKEESERSVAVCRRFMEKMSVEMVE